MRAQPRRRVLLLLENFGGGTGNHVCQLADLWLSWGWQVTIITQSAPLVQQLPNGLVVHVVRGGAWYDRFPIAQMRRLLELRRFIAALRPDVVHTYFFWSIIYGRVLKFMGHVPVLVENREDMGFSWGWGAYVALRFTRRIPNRVICVAGAVRENAVRRERIAPARTLVVHNGVAPNTQPGRSRDEMRRLLGFTEDDVVVGMVANLPRAVKGGRHLIELVGEIISLEPSVRFLLVGVGSDDPAMRAELEALGISQHVVGVGYRRDVEDCYAAMDISVLTSSTEGLSITLLESMRSALPTVVTRVGGNGELVVDGETGFLVRFNDWSSFADRIVRLARDGSLRRRMGEAGRHRIATQFSAEAAAQSYLEVYEEMAQISGQARSA